MKSYKTQLQSTKQALVEAQSKAVDDERRSQRLENDLRAEKEKSKVSEAAAERVTAELISLKTLNEELRYEKIFIFVNYHLQASTPVIWTVWENRLLPKRRRATI